ncbi:MULTISPECIES: nuclease-related domain-containing protein [Sphingomonas]|uniref:nuclease-related domain-containing protein n=1 Tax=Sphingomonas TaxID=13687 RepID=UPI000DEEBC39|nr:MULTISPECIES: nuclease-related domain-containing protein [Sphingomonas]
MILKTADDREDDVIELERLRLLAPSSSQTAIDKQIANIRSGAAGERSAAHFIDLEFGKSERVAIFHDLRIGTDGDYAQIDHLLIHRLQATAWVLETKNYNGRLSCDEHGDWTLWRGGKPISVPSPINQARRQCQALQLWLDAHGYTWLRNVHPVVLISPKSSVDRRKLSPDEHVVKADNFATWWKEQAGEIGLGTALQMLGRHAVSGLSPTEFEAFGRTLVGAHEPIKFDWAARIGISKAVAEVVPVPEKPQADSETYPSQAATPNTVRTPFGEIKISRVSAAQVALRNDSDPRLIAVVRNACKGKGRWVPRYRNWLIADDDLGQVLDSIRQTAVDAKCAEPPTE